VVKPTSYIVGYKDHRNAKTRYFGPFVSESVADYFKANLPLPTDSGFCRTVMLQPFQVQEGHQVAQLIRRERE